MKLNKPSSKQHGRMLKGGVLLAGSLLVMMCAVGYANEKEGREALSRSGQKISPLTTALAAEYPSLLEAAALAKEASLNATSSLSSLPAADALATEKAAEAEGVGETVREEEAASPEEQDASGESIPCVLSAVPLEEDLQRFIYDTCHEYNIEYPLFLAMIWQESRFRTDAVNLNANGTKDSGLMQINDVNHGWLAERYGIVDMFDPRQNIRAGAIMFSGYAAKYSDEDALTAYRYGEAGMLSRKSNGKPRDEAVEKILIKAEEFRLALPEAAR